MTYKLDDQQHIPITKIRQIAEAEARALLGEAICELSIIAQSTEPIDKLTTRKELILIIRKIEQADECIRNIP